MKNPPSTAHTLSNQTITALNPKSHETVKLIPVNVTSTSSVLTNSQNQFAHNLPIISPATFKTYMDAKKAALPTSVSSASSSKSGTLTHITLSKPLTPVALSTNSTSFSINNALQSCSYSPIKSNTFTSIKGSTITTLKPGTVTLSKPSTVVSSSTSPSRKLVTLVGSNAILKQTEFGHKIPFNLKNAAVFNEMTKPEKLRHLYKCMGKDCAYTTDYVEHFRRHFEKHSAVCDAIINSTAPFDFKHCAYCNVVVSNWAQMEQHYEEKHAYCEFQCGYCFYRALTQSYVELHQVGNLKNYF